MSRTKKRKHSPFSALVLVYVGQHLTLLSLPPPCIFITLCQNDLTMLLADRSKETDAWPCLWQQHWLFCIPLILLSFALLVSPRSVSSFRNFLLSLRFRPRCHASLSATHFTQLSHANTFYLNAQNAFERWLQKHLEVLISKFHFVVLPQSRLLACKDEHDSLCCAQPSHF